MRIERQTTIGERVRLSGIGVHSGAPANIDLIPAAAGTGICFVRSDMDPTSLIEARFDNVVATELCTVISDAAGRSVATVEHLMAALAASGVDNAIVEIDGPEMPIMDGSSRPFLDAVEQVGVVHLSSPRRYLRVRKPVRVEQGRGWAELRPFDAGFRVEVTIDFDTPLIGRQTCAMDVSADTFRREVACARTFGFMRDVEQLWKAGYARGASLENTVAIGDDRVVNPEGLRYPDEFSRHKALDAIGDLALAGLPILGAFRSYCGGHRLNVAMLQAVYSDSAAFEIVEADVATRPSRRPMAARADIGGFAPVPAYAPESR
jgi:UDP-3-O-[3-hydroxymyristoyl] N-acetylglucosamine deacetylase